MLQRTQRAVQARDALPPIIPHLAGFAAISSGDRIIINSLHACSLAADRFREINISSFVLLEKLHRDQ